MFDALSKSKRKPATQQKSSRADSNAALRKVIGENFKTAREINGWDQTYAAVELFHYSNSTQLSLIEQGRRLAPHQTIIDASRVYGVSVDFLIGLSDEPERDPKAAERNAIMRHFHDLLERNAQTQVSLLMQYLASGIPSLKTAEKLLQRAELLVDEVRATQRLNPKLFDDKLKNGSKLVKAAGEMELACTDAREMLSRHERLMEFKTRRVEQRTGATHPLLDLLKVGMPQ